MFSSRIVAVTVGLGGLSLVPGRAVASPYLVDSQEVMVEPPDATASSVVVETPAAQITVTPAANAPTRTTILVGAPPSALRPDVATLPPRAREGGLGLMITGFSMFAASYLLTAWAGALVYDGEGGCTGTRERCREIGKALMIPFAGPILAAHEIDGARDTVSLLFASGVQIATFTMGLVGAVRQSRYKRWERRVAGIPLGASGLTVQPMPRLGGGGLGLNYRF